MTYSTHSITKSGHIELREETETGFHRSVIAPNEPIPESYKAEIEADPDFAKYRTAENATAYEAQIEAMQPTEAEQLESWRQSASLSRRRFKIGEALYQVNGTPLVQLIEALLAGLTEPTKTVATISYEQSGNFDRVDPFILQFSQTLGMSEEETDAFFHYCINEEWDNE